ncbi:hypothetical protein QQY66_33835 [Streptomyces sp. DG2A-72]|uniref:hypothetical protein n=1 Tax=Streptomyces sp. DG2A-72 TaxID=3051386 RepID=UPI00265C8382|nr:hypothetical protein [Streptomyces sp. DG2A-72]MDO0936441.1 hypothetical protein [Streptomyces sp. DG2A-72]
MHISEFTHALADRLPGWQPSPTSVPIADDPASNRIWDSGPLPYAAFQTDGVQRSVLTHHWGLQLYVMPRPHRPDEYLVLPMLPANTSHQHVQGLKAPRGIAVPADPVRAAAKMHCRLLANYRFASPTPIRRSSPGHLQVHVTFDTQQRPRIRTGYIGAFIELLAHGGFLLDPATGECHLPDTLTPEQTKRQLIKSLQRLRHRDFHITMHSTEGPRSHPPLPPVNPHKGNRR